MKVLKEFVEIGEGILRVEQIGEEEEGRTGRTVEGIKRLIEFF